LPDLNNQYTLFTQENNGKTTQSNISFCIYVATNGFIRPSCRRLDGGAFGSLSRATWPKVTIAADKNAIAQLNRKKPRVTNEPQPKLSEVLAAQRAKDGEQGCTDAGVAKPVQMTLAAEHYKQRTVRHVHLCARGFSVKR